MVTVVVMGVAGCGKSTIGVLLAERLKLEYAEADVFHPPANVAKMASGQPLKDEDRLPWLVAIGDHLRAYAGTGVVVSCSALKRSYRDQLRAVAPRAWFVHLVLDEATAACRVAARSDHFMPASLVASQFAALEPLDGEAGVVVDATRTPERIVASVLAALPPTGEEGEGSAIEKLSSRRDDGPRAGGPSHPVPPNTCVGSSTRSRIWVT